MERDELELIEKLDHMCEMIKELTEIVKTNVCYDREEKIKEDKKIIDMYDMIREIAHNDELKEIERKILEAENKKKDVEEEIKLLEAEKIFSDERYYGKD